MNDREKIIHDLLVKKGWKVFVRGWPDFLVMKQDLSRGFALELKSNGDKLSEDQIAMHKSLAAWGMYVLTAKYEEIDQIARKHGTVLFTTRSAELLKIDLQETKYEYERLKHKIEEMEKSLQCYSVLLNGEQPSRHFIDPINAIGFK